MSVLAIPRHGKTRPDLGGFLFFLSDEFLTISLLRCSFLASDGKDKIKTMLLTQLAPEVRSGNIQNLGVIRVLDYTCNTIGEKQEKYRSARSTCLILQTTRVSLSSEI
jgi:hypothetical protein